MAALIVSVVLAQDTGIGAASFLHFGVDARSLGMGGAFVSLAEGFSAVYWNPAGLVQTSSARLGGTTMDLYGAGINLAFIGGVLPPNSPNSDVDSFSWKRIGVGAALTQVATEVHVFDQFGEPLGLVQYTERCFSLGLGYAFSNSGSLGLVLKGYLFRAPEAGVDGRTAWAMGIGVDIGFLFKLRDNLRLGIKVSDLGDTRIKWHNTPTEPVDLALSRYYLGMCYQFNEGAIALSYEFSRKEPTRGIFRAGLEYRIEFLSFRMGLVKPLDAEWYLTAGIGVRADWFCLDAAWLQNKALKADSATDTIVLSIAFSLPELSNR